MSDQTPQTAPMLCIHHTKDANQQAASLINWQQEYDQLSDGRFLGQIRERRFPNFHVFREDSNRSLRQQCRVEQGGIWLGLSAENKPLHLNHSKFNASQLLLRQGGADFELMTPEQFSIYGIVLDRKLVQIIEKQLELDGIGCNTPHLAGPTEKHIQQLKFYLGTLLGPTESRWSDSTHQVVLKDIVLELFSISSPSASHPISISHRQHVMRRIKQQLHDLDYRTPITVSELCDAVHVSRRTLQYTFEHCCNTSPKQFIHRMRLNQVRRVLQCPEDNRTIAEIAFDFGFFHLGQFSQSYKRLFGETPTETRKWESSK
ncbi:MULTISPECIES: helix-turn-helix domain-containing protein [Vibrio]|uniref:helix-turn-helix domain-containing protein n=1 Tax=Vibrio TaxID=662 RepID=UPI00062C0141|nr:MULTISPECIES: helix-turn-helix domain-containing protein [Vibrio]MCE9843965.1 helix-turn-helix domain-containing protein [Vibrio antiquarius]